MENLISVIIPVYNVEKYLRQCIDSVINQTYKNLEIILVNDGSSDNSGKICDEYADKDLRIKVIHKKNEGVSAARNTGVKIASGKWLYFMDSDDYIEPETFKESIEFAEKNNCDLCFFDYDRVYKNKAVLQKTIDSDKTIFNDMSNINTLIDYESGIGVNWNFIVKKSCFSGKVSYDYGVKIYEDVLVKLKLYPYLESFCYIHKVFYHYRVVKSGATVVLSKKVGYDKILIDHLYAFSDILKNGDYPKNSEIILNSRVIRMLSNVGDYAFNRRDLPFSKRVKIVINYLESDFFKNALNNYDKKICGNSGKLFLKFRKVRVSHVFAIYILKKIKNCFIK